MRVSKSFLSDYIDIKNTSYNEIAAKMVLAGNEYESVSKLSDAKGLVVGEVLECSKHPESSKLSICQVNYGEGVKQILCGASNVRAGIKVIIAKVGSKLGDLEIKVAKLAGMESNGMICSLSELGIENKYLSEEDKIGIHILPSDAEIGLDAVKYLGYDDEIIDFELTSNRGDLLSILGMAYEVGAIYGLTVKEPSVKLKETDDINSLMNIKVETENCSIYLGKLVKNIVITESPQFIKNRLIASGIRPINNVVDISNYVMLEYGQPLHFFDADRLGKTVGVRMAKDREYIKTLDGQERFLSNTDIVITNGTDPVALAGVMGGYDTEIEATTRNIFIESAIFKPSTIRNTAKKILRSEASNRYEKGIDPNRALLALNRACDLLTTYASGDIIGGVLTHDKADKKNKNIDIAIEKINSVLGLKLDKKVIDKIFNNLGFDYSYDKEYHIKVPTRRIDISIKEDIIEEVGRLNGYDNLEGKLPIVSMKEGKTSDIYKFTKAIHKRLQSLNLNQVITYSLINENDLNRFTEVINPVYLSNPMSEDRKVLRSSHITSLLNVFNYNISRNREDINIYEVGAIYYLENDSYIEENKVSGLLFGNYLNNNWQNNNTKVDFYIVKGIIENLLNYLGFNNRYEFKKEALIDMHPGRCATIYIDNQRVGFIGQIHPKIEKKEVYVFELSITKLLSFKVRNIKYKEVSKFPSIKKDVAFITTHSAQDITNVIKKTGSRLLTDIDIFDVYEKADQKSIAFSLTFNDMTRTLTEEEVMEIFNRIIKEVETKTASKLKSL